MTQRWRVPNRLAYWLYYLAGHQRAWRLGRWAPDLAAVKGAVATSPRPLLYLTWGRLGDTVLGTALTRHLGALFGRPVVLVGRPEIRPIVADHVDRFVPFASAEWSRSAAYRAAFATECAADYEIIIGDIHLFHGGNFHFNGLIDRLSARHKFVYQGYAGSAGLAPLRSWPKTAHLVPSLTKPRRGSAEQLHVWQDLVHYVAAIGDRLGVDLGSRLATFRPQLDLGIERPDGVLSQYALTTGDYIAVQPFSNNPKKDFPLAGWRAVLDALPEHRFVLLGSQRQSARATSLAAPHVLDLCGRTRVEDAIALVRHARAFVGGDSGLTHVACNVGQRTVCVAQSSNLGYFFPYPAALDRGNLEVVDNQEFRECAGCFMVCSREPIVRTYRRGALCLRTLPAAAVVAAVRRAVAPAAVVATP